MNALRGMLSGRVPIQSLLAYGFGFLFLLIALAVGIGSKNPTEFLQWIVRVTVALAAAGVASIIPGLFGARWAPAKGTAVRVTGALAVFLVIFLVNPPKHIGPKPEIVEWQVYPEGVVPEDQEITVRWNVKDADTVFVDPFGNQDEFSGSLRVTPAVDRQEYQLSASKDLAVVESDEKVVIVATPVPGQPKIKKFEVSPKTLVLGESEAGMVTLSWETSNPKDEVQILTNTESFDDLKSSGIKSIDVSETTTYTVIARNDGPSEARMYAVVVVEPPPPPKSAEALCGVSKQLEEQGLEAIWIESFDDEAAFQEGWTRDNGKPLIQLVNQPDSPCGGSLRITGERGVSHLLPSGSRPTYVAFSFRVNKGSGSVGGFEIVADDCDGRRGALFRAESTDGILQINTFGAAGYEAKIEPDSWHLVELPINWDEQTLDLYLDGNKVNSESMLFATTAPAPAGCISLHNKDNLISFWDEIAVAGSPDVPPLAPTPTPAPSIFPWALPYRKANEYQRVYYPNENEAFCLPSGYIPIEGDNPYSLNVSGKYATWQVIEVNEGETTCYRVQVDMNPIRRTVSSSNPFKGTETVIDPATFSGEFRLIGRRR